MANSARANYIFHIYVCLYFLLCLSLQFYIRTWPICYGSRSSNRSGQHPDRGLHMAHWISHSRPRAISVTRRRFNVRGSLHHSKIHKEKSNKMQKCIKILLFHIYMKLNMFFGRHTVHHQEPKTALAGSGFSYVEGFGRVVGGRCPPATRPTTLHI